MLQNNLIIALRRLARQPVTDSHLHLRFVGELGSTSDIRYLWLFGSVAVLVVLIACVNYMNLATSLASCCASEFGVRKTVGSTGSEIAGQFLVESVLTGKSIELNHLQEGAVLALVALGVGLLAGSSRRPSWPGSARSWRCGVWRLDRAGIGAF